MLAQLCAVAVDKVDDAIGHTGFSQDFLEHQCRQRGLFCRLQHAAAPGRQRRGKFGGGVERWTVPRDDQSDDTGRFLDGVGVHRRLVPRESSRHSHIVGDPVDLRTPAGEVAEEFHGRSDVALGLWQRHARVQRVDLGQIVGPRLEQLRDAPQHLRPLSVRLLVPHARVERLSSPGDRGVDGRSPPVHELSDLLLGHRVDDRDGFALARTRTKLVDRCLYRHGCSPPCLFLVNMAVAGPVERTPEVLAPSLNEGIAAHVR